VDAVIRILIHGLIYMVSVVVVAWTAGALFYDVCRASKFAWSLVFLWLASVSCLFLVWQPLWKPFLLTLSVFGLFLLWWRSQKPSNHRNWNSNFSNLARIEIEGDAVTIHNVRNTEYRSLQDFTTHYETRTKRLSNLVGVDVVITYWGSSWICHPMLVFDFGPEGRICISIEVRYRQDQKYGFLPSLYRQQEICYVFCDERDAILKRSKYSENHDVYLYRLSAENDEIQKVFLEYVVSANDLAERPRWYNGLTTNCTTSIYRQRAREVDWDWRWLFNGQLDQMIYDRGRLDTSLPFEELKQKSWVNEIANHAPAENFGDTLRRELSVYQTKPIADGHDT